MAREADFSSATRRIVAARAGYRCSFPGCGRLTVGPGQRSGEVETTGRAAHIFSSSPGGPRGTGGLDAEKRKRPANGLWLCSTHAGLIDSHEGKRYPEHELQRWKAMHEARIDHEHRALPVPFGWVSRMTISRSPLFVPNTIVDLAKVTLFVGDNGVGKTAVCEWLAAICGDISKACRWMHRRAEREPVDLELQYGCPEPRTLQALIDAGRTEFSIDGAQDTLGLGHCVQTIYLHEDPNFGNVDLVSTLAAACGVHRQRVVQVVPHLRSLRLPFVQDVAIANLSEAPSREMASDLEGLAGLGTDRPMDVRFRIGNHPTLFSLAQLSGREVSIAVVSTGIALADMYSRHVCTVLVVDLGANFMPDGVLNEYARVLTEGRFGFQSILVSPTERPEVDWNGWSIARLVGKPPTVTVEQKQVAL